MSKYHAVSSGVITKAALPSITRQRGTTTGTANLMLYGAGKTTVSNNTTFIDSSANAFTVTRNGDTVQSGFNPFSQASAGAGYFDGTGDYLSLANNAAFDFGTGNFTIELWVNFNSINYVNGSGGRGATVIGNTSGFSGNGWNLGLSGNSSGVPDGIAFNSRQGSSQVTVSASVTMANSTWYHIAVVRSGTLTSIYLNGVSVGSGTLSNQTVSSVAALWVGGQDITNYQHWCNGYISNARVVKGTAVYTSNFTPPTSPLTAISGTSLLLLMDNYSIVNSTSTNLPVTINTGASISTAQFPTGMSSSMLFNGTTGYVDIPNGGIFQFGTGDFTIEWWQYQTGSNPYPRVFSIGTYPTAFGVSVEFGSIYYWTNTASAAIRSTAGVANTWVHIAVSRSSSVTRIFLNGVQLGANISDTANISNSATALRIAAETTPAANTYFTGYISNFRSIKGSGLYTANFTPASLPMPTTVTVPNFVTNNIYGLNQIP